MMINKKILKIILASMVAVIIVLGLIFAIKRYSGNNTIAQFTSQLPDLEAATRLEAILLGEHSKMYGIDASQYDVEVGEVESGQTFSKLLNGRYNVNIAVINQLIEKCKNKFDLRDMRAGNAFAAFTKDDSTRTLDYLVYEKSPSEYVTFACADSIYVKTSKKEVTTEERYAEGVIESSLYATMDKNGLSPILAGRMADIFKHTIDFFAIAKGDKFRVLYEEQFIDTTRIGIGHIYGIEFTHQNKPYLAVRFEQNGESGYWDGKGQNLRKAFLMAPLSFSARISSKFGVRIHPIRRTRQQHNGVDYAAPKGTPVHAVADGVVTAKGWDRGGGGNRMWIKHAQGIESAYLHLNNFASGMAVGKRVIQGQIIAYVGTTGASTGPHLDFRIKQSGKYINPLKIPSVPSDPISKGNKTAFDNMKNDILKVMDEYQKN